MAEIVQAFLDMKSDVKNLITVLRELNNHLGHLEKSIKVVEEVSKTFQRNEANLKRLIDEMEKTNKNISSLLGVVKAKEVK